MSSLVDLNGVSALQEQIQPRFFSKEQMALLDKTKVPQHVAIIPDGNRRWAKREEFDSGDGHREGADILMDIVKSGRELGIKTMTFYTFSTENWHRESEEVAGLMWLLETYLSNQCQEMIDWGIRFQTIGDLSKLPIDLKDTVVETKLATSKCDKITMVLALNYGSRDELCRAIQSIVTDCSEEKIQRENITDELVSTYLDTYPFQDPELLIRTSGEMRISNFLLWQLSYSEIYISNVLWPDYRPYHLFEAIYNYQQRERRLGRS